MGIFNFNKRKINKNAKPQPKVIHENFGGGLNNLYGVDSTAFACIDRICTEFALLNYGIFKAGDREKARRHPLYNVLKQPNLDDYHFNFFYQSARDYFESGGCFWLLARYDGEVVSIFRLPPKEVKVTRNIQTNRREFLYRGKIYTQDEVAYIPSRFWYSTFSGGQSIFDAIPNIFTTSKNMETFTQSSFTNGVLGKRLVVDISNLAEQPTDEQIATLKSNMQSEYAGVENVSRPLFKKKGVEYTYIGDATDNRASELAENRELQINSMATLFAVTKKILNGDSPSEMDFALFSKFAIQPIATPFEEVINSLLDENRFHFEFDYNGVMKVSLQSRIDAYTKQINNGILSLNEVRLKENLAPIEAGDTNFMPVNMMPWNDEIKEAYMAKQKQTAQSLVEESTGDNNTDPLDEDTQHIPQGDDKQ